MSLAVPESELEFSFARSSGPGGQNVNKVESKVVLRWDVVRSRAIPEAVRARFLQRFANRISSAGELVLQSQRTRDQARNRADCIERLREMLAQVERPPRPRRATRPSRAAIERRLQAKRQASERKRRRRPPSDD